ncbi:MAG: hypothetical protein ABJJ37_26980 [Roseibium sp.]
MRCIAVLATVIAAGLFPVAGLAQSAETLLQTAILAEGRSCPQVVIYKGIGQTSGGSGLLAVAYSNGRHHVVEMRQDLSLNYLFSCSTYEAVAKKTCF